MILILIQYSHQQIDALDDSIIQKDLYGTLDLTANVDKSDIKRAYRKLAQIHHPDKSSSKDKEKNEMLFREIAEAYEILSNDDKRSEYDMARTYYNNNGHGGGGRGSDYRYSDRQGSREMYEQYQRQQQQQYDDYVDQMREFEAFVEEHADEIEHHLRQQELEWLLQPKLTGPILPEGEVMLPYSPIMTSSDGEYFALLDFECSLQIWQGDPQHAIHHVYSSDEVPDFYTFARLLYHTKPHNELEGKCFVGLDDRGILSIYQGFPDQYNPEALWASETDSDAVDDEARMFRRYFLELTDGSLSIQALRPGDPDGECIWSTTSCDEYIALVKNVGQELFHFMGKIFGDKIRKSKKVLKERGWLSLLKVLGGSTVTGILKTSIGIATFPVRLILMRLDKNSSNDDDDEWESILRERMNRNY